ncbi:MAG: response regulator [Chthoniobacteraceae bacterium]
MKGSVSAKQAVRLRIFIVENHRDTLKYLTMYLEACGHSVQSARTMKAALEALPSADCDMLISAIGLPDGDGWELMRQLNLPRSVFAVAISGYGTEADQAKSKEVGFRRHLVKPIGGEDLAPLIEEAARQLVA